MTHVMYQEQPGGPAPSLSPPASINLAQWVRTQRRLRGWSQRELSRRSGMSRGTVARLETGQGRPQRRTRLKLRRVFLAATG